MKISEQWLREWTNPAYGRDELVARLTMAGLEVDAVIPVAGAFTGVVVGRILAAEKHPEADKLRVCRVDAGEGRELQIVCGAPNARAGLCAPLAMVGARLPGDLHIKPAKLRGVESQGMLCGADELGIDIPGDGLLELPDDAPAGEDLRKYLGLDDVTLELGLTPNRGDCLGVLGLAREVAAFSRIGHRALSLEGVPASCDARFPVRVSAPVACPRYVGRVLRDVNVGAPSPLWLREKLRRSGIRSIDAVVDVTNFVMLELGQPMHAFDLDRLEGGIEVRMAQPGEQLVLLDGRELTLEHDTLVIADEAKPLALAGIMGGRDSGVSAQTRNLLLESAFFAPLAVAGRARRHGLHTDSSHRFERGVDSTLQQAAVERATQLILSVCGGSAGPVLDVTSNEYLPRVREVELRAARIREVLGLAIAGDEVEEMLARLGMEVSTQESGERWIVLVPPHRHDIAIEVDLIEELARLYGYDRLPTTPPQGSFRLGGHTERQLPLADLKRVLVARDYQEVVTYTFVDPALQAHIEPGLAPLALANPISADMAVMRTTLWAGLLATARHNLARQQQRLRLFEAGLRFRPAEAGLQQEPALAGLVLGPVARENWADGRRAADFFDARGDLEALLALGGDPGGWAFERAAHPALHPGQSARLVHGGHTVGWIGALHPRVAAALDLPAGIFLYEVLLSALQAARVPRFSELSRFPAVRRDLALVVPAAVPASRILELAREAAGEWLRDLVLFDVWQGEAIGPDRRSIALGLTFQHASRTLVDDEVNGCLASVITLLEQQVSAKLRD